MSSHTPDIHQQRLAAHAEWEWYFLQVQDFIHQRGHHDLGQHPAGEWLRLQIRMAASGALSAERQQRLTALGIDLQAPLPPSPEPAPPPSPDNWSSQLASLADFQREHGHCDVPKRWSTNPSLANWVSQQRQTYRNGQLPHQRITQLEQLGFDWTPGRQYLERLWQQRYQQLTEFAAQHGHTRVPKSPDHQLWSWRHVQREFRKKGILSAERIARLDAIGFEWQDANVPFAKSREERWEMLWEKHYQELVAFHREFGHCHVLTGWQGNPKLAAWVLVQRNLQAKGQLRPDRHARLDALGFLWSVENLQWDARWDRRYQQLCAYQQQHGHTRTPKSHDFKLWSWRHIQRDYRRKGILSSERIARLDAIGFEWEEVGQPFAKSREERWELLWQQRYEQLISYQRRFGTTHVVTGWPEDPRLAVWVGDQRERHREGNLLPDRRAKLDAIGFLWSPGRPVLESLWEKRFTELVAYQQQHGHTRVSKSQNLTLWAWRHNQRAFRKKGVLSPERIALLDAIGFEWGGDHATPRPQT